MLGFEVGVAGPLRGGETALACSSPKGFVGSEKGFSTFSLGVLAGRSEGLPFCGGVRLRLTSAAAAPAGTLRVVNGFPWLFRCPISSGMRRLIGRKSSIGAKDLTLVVAAVVVAVAIGGGGGLIRRPPIGAASAPNAAFSLCDFSSSSKAFFFLQYKKSTPAAIITTARSMPIARP